MVQTCILYFPPYIHLLKSKFLYDSRGDILHKNGDDLWFLFPYLHQENLWDTLKMQLLQAPATKTLEILWVNKIMRLLQDFFFLILYVNKILTKAMIGNLLFMCSCSWLNMTFEA